MTTEVIDVEGGQFEGNDGSTGVDQMQQKDWHEMIVKMEIGNKRDFAELERQKLLAQFTQLQSDQKAILGRISELGKEQKQRQDEKWAKVLSPPKDLQREKNRNGELVEQVETGASSCANCEKFAEKFVVMELTIKNKDLEIRALQAEIREQKLFTEHNASLEGKVVKMKQKQQQHNIEDAAADQTQNLTPIKTPQANCWDANTCHNALSVIGPECLAVHHKGKYGCFVFAKHPILHTDSPNYFEVKIEGMRGCVAIGLAVKAFPLNRWVYSFGRCSCAYHNDGLLVINNSLVWKVPTLSFSAGDVVGCGLSLSTHEIIFTKNGQRLDAKGCVCSSSYNALFPCVYLTDNDDQIEANFGPTFKFDFGTLFYGSLKK